MSAPPFHVLQGHLTTPDGWTLLLRRGVRAGAASQPRRGPPVLLVPGFAMNTSIFAWHPTGPSFLEHLLDAGFDPWTVDLRGSSTSRVGKRAAALQDMAFVDIPATLDHIAQVTGYDRVHAIGCSLGGALLYAHVGRDAHRIDRLATMGSPLVWQDRTLVLEVFSRLGPLLSRVPVVGSRPAARLALPVLRLLLPDLLGFYLNPRITDTRDSRRLSDTVDDPVPAVSHHLSQWIKGGHLELDGHHVTDGLASFDRPLLVVYAEGDGVVPPQVARSVATCVRGPVELLKVDDADHRVSHVDIFLADFVHDRVYDPIAAWLHKDLSAAVPAPVAPAA